MNRAIKYLFSFRCVALLCALFFMQQSTAQTVPVYGDSTRLSKLKNGAGNELIIESSTKNIAGALVNYANGRTHFVVVIDTSWALNDSTTRYHRTNGGTYDITKHSTGSVTSSVAWGSITGTLSAQTDLQAALNAKFNNPTGTTLQYIRGDGSLATFPTNVSTFTNDAGYITGNQSITWTGSNDVTGTATGTTSLTPSLTVNWANGFSVYDARYLTASTQNEVISGGKVTWLHDYVYNVSAATYLIDGVNYSSPSTDITLSTADATDDRIDVFVLTTSGTAIAITGTPSTPAVEPAIDANTQLQISFADVNAGSTSPTLNIDWIYQENTEWATATSSPGTVNLSSTNTPYAGSKDIEGTSVANGTTVTFTSTSTPTMGNYQNLVFEIKSKANWSTTKKWVLRFFNGTTAIGNPVNFGSSSYGFVSTSTSQYQTITIPLSDFGSISTATKFIITQSNSSGTIGWFLDNMQLQGGGGGGTPSTITLVNDVTGTGTNTIPATVIAIRNKSVPTLATGNLRFNGTIWVFDNATYLTGNQSITISGDATGTGTTSIPLTLATVNSSPGTYGSASQSLTGTVNGKGLLTSLSAQNIQIAESQVTNLTTDLAAKQGTLTLTTTGTSGASTLVGSTLNIPQYSGGGGGVAGNNKDMYFNDAGTTNAVDSLQYDKTNKVVTNTNSFWGTTAASTQVGLSVVNMMPATVSQDHAGPIIQSGNYAWKQNTTAGIQQGWFGLRSRALTGGSVITAQGEFLIGVNTAFAGTVVGTLSAASFTLPSGSSFIAYGGASTLGNNSLAFASNGTISSGGSGSTITFNQGGQNVAKSQASWAFTIQNAGTAVSDPNNGSTFGIAQNTAGSISGTATNLIGSNAVTGTSTLFTKQFIVGDQIRLTTGTAETQTVATITDDTHLTTSANFTNAHTASGINNLSGGIRFNVFNNGKTGIGTTTPAQSALLDVSSTSQGFLPPRMTTTQRDAIVSPAEGLIIYNLTTHKLNVYTGSAWEQVTSS